MQLIVTITEIVVSFAVIQWEQNLMVGHTLLEMHLNKRSIK